MLILAPSAKKGVDAVIFDNLFPNLQFAIWFTINKELEWARIRSNGSKVPNRQLSFLRDFHLALYTKHFLWFPIVGLA